MADVDSPDLVYFGSWSKDPTLPFPDATYSNIAINQDRVFISKYSSIYDSDTILYNENSQWNYNDVFEHGNVNDIRFFDNILYITHTYYILGYDADLNLVENIWTYNYEFSPKPREIIIDQGVSWIADGTKGLVKKIGSNSFKFISPDGPEIPDVFDISIENNELWKVAGGRNLSWNSLYKYGNTSSFIDSEWNTFNRSNTPALDSIRDLLCVAINPYNSSQVFMGSWSLGLLDSLLPP